MTVNTSRLLGIRLKRVLSMFVFTVLLACTSNPENNKEVSKPDRSVSRVLNDHEHNFTIAIAGDWGDKWGLKDSLTKQTTTRDSMFEAAKDDLLVLLGDLSYGKDTGVKHGPEQARHWCGKAQKFSNDTPMIFVPGDHDSRLQDGDIPTYVKCLTAPEELIKSSADSVYGEYPYLYYVDIGGGASIIRIVGTSIAFQEEESEPASAQKYFKNYEKGKKNYRWLQKTYREAYEKGYWLIHINHLPCIDMGKNQSFGQGCEDVVNLSIKEGVSIMFTGSSHNIWRTHLLAHSEKCSHVPLTKKATGANPDCAIKNELNTYKRGSGMLQAHAGAGGKTSASKQAPPCDPRSDGEAAHYLAPGTCKKDNVPGFVRLKVTETHLSGEYVLTQKNKILEPYSFTFIK